MNRNKFSIFLGIIVALGLLIRLIGLNKVPNHLGNDEISIAYDSYSIRTTGRDEHNQYLPISFESHRTYKAPLYAYLNIPFNKLLGNNEYGVRVLSAIAGGVAILFISLIAKEMGGYQLALLSAILLMICPKSIFSSRMAYESNLAATMLVIGVWGMVKYVKDQKKLFLWIAGIFLGISVWGYHTEWGLAPMISLAIPLIFRKNIKLKKWILMWGLILVIAMPVWIDFVYNQSKDSNNRASTQMWYKQPGSVDFYKDKTIWWPKRAVNFVMAPVFNYIEYFSNDILYSNGLNMTGGREPLNSGWYLLATLPLFVVGLVKSKLVWGKYRNIVVIWLLLSPIIPATTYDGLTTVRNLAAIMPTILIQAGGANFLWSKYRKIFWWLLGLVGMNWLLFLVSYFIHFPVVSGDGFQYGYKQAYEFIKPIEANYDKVVVEPNFGPNGWYVGVPHLYFGYFGAFSPSDMLKRVDADGTFIGKYVFKHVDWNREQLEPKSLYIVSKVNVEAGKALGKLNLLSTIKKPDFTDQFLIYETTIVE